MNDSGEHAANQITEPSKDEQDISSSMLLNDQHQLNNAGLKRKTQTDGNILNPATKQAGISVDSNTSKEITKPKKKAENKADSAAQLPNPKDGSQESLGLKRFLVGISYQQKLAIVILCHVAKQMEDDKKFDFTITSEDPEAGKFDDIAVRFNFGGRSSRLFIQAKHKEDETKTITWADLKSVDKNAPFSVCKYLNSFLQQKWDTDEEPPILALCTTIGLAEDVKKSAEPYTSPESIVNSIFNSVANEIYNIDIDKLDSDSRNSLFEHKPKLQQTSV
ncbi:hypothetical protein ZHAS_00017853 [Anopheles sinensis]|uniref:Uncharacterized protein n=1 Tax=Anopheles sinensis TaxID=74873 RepID=A0A084WHY8_ANOSI|nr:hypothetical protein ZHAS_00017853 [Anopheles sinensis]